MVSTRAPARGATLRDLIGRYRTRVSTRAPARGATALDAAVVDAPACFNPRAREGRDLAVGSYRRPGGVSTRAPARGATKSREGTGEQDRSFNPRAREGRDVIDGRVRVPLSKEFQPARPRGARP